VAVALFGTVRIAKTNIIENGMDQEKYQLRQKDIAATFFKLQNKYMGKKIRVIKAKKDGQKDIHFKEGGLHASTGTSADKPISAAKHAEAKSGELGPKAKKQEQFYENVLKK
jgi:hypothetical protein